MALNAVLFVRNQVKVRNDQGVTDGKKNGFCHDMLLHRKHSIICISQWISDKYVEHSVFEV